MFARKALVLILTCLLTVLVSAAAQGQAHLWSQRFGSASTNGFEEGRDVALDAAGGIIVTGHFSDTVDFGGGPRVSAGFNDVFVAKFARDGAHIWSRRFGGPQSDEGRAIAADHAGNVLLTGEFSGTIDFGGGLLTSVGRAPDLFVAKLDVDGAHVWSRAFGSEFVEEISAVAFDNRGNALVTGEFQGTVDLGGGPLTSTACSDIFVAKYGPDGDHRWSRRFGGTSWDKGRSIAVTVDDNVIVTGFFERTVNFGGGTLASKGGGDIFLAKFDAQGDHVWSAGYGGALSDDGYDIASDRRGSILLTGFFRHAIDFGGGPITARGPGDIFLASFDEGGAHVWSRGMGSETAVRPSLAYSVATNPRGDVAITGLFDTAVDLGGGLLETNGAYDIFVAKYDRKGRHLWSRSFGGILGDRGSGIALDARGDVVMTGAFVDNVDFGGGPRVAAGTNDIIIAKYEGKSKRLALQLETRPAEFSLRQNFPNPFNPTTTIRYDVPASGGHVGLRVYDVTGRLVRTLVNGEQTPGAKKVVWNGTNDQGEGVATGVYFCRLVAPGYEETRRIVFLK
jgi:hypothetical protein